MKQDMPESHPDNLENQNYRLGQRLAIAGLIISAGLAFIKLTGGILSRSASLSADGMESAGDVFTSMVVWGGMAIARRPADSRYPYGYGRAEALAGKTVGTILLMSAVLLITHSVHRLNGPSINLPSWTLWPLALSFILKGVLASIKFRTGRKIRSSSLVADSGNDAVDMLSALVAAIAIILNLIDHERFAYADPIGALGVALIIFIMGLKIFRETSRELMDSQPRPEVLEQVRAVAAGIPHVLDVEKCYARKSGTQFFFDLHIEVDPNMTVHDAHGLSHHVKDVILAECDFVKDVLIHIEPHENNEESSPT